MAANVENVTLEILKTIQGSLVDLRMSISELREDMGRQFNSFAEEARKDRRKINGLMTIIQSVSGDFDERIRDMDDRVSILENRAS